MRLLWVRHIGHLLSHIMHLFCEFDKSRQEGKQLASASVHQQERLTSAHHFAAIVPPKGVITVYCDGIRHIRPFKESLDNLIV